ncbi:MAG: hypothetical protein LBK03_04220, partial [Bacteroidales bacterium]|nr:hypothetical protein [Bacteroidales bacterium]
GDLALLTQLAEQQGVQIVKQNEFMPLWYRLSVTGNSAGDAVQMANAFYETGLFEEIDPAFMFNFQSNCTNDPMFDQLWGLQNRTYGYDINACRAWTILMDMG